MRTYTEKEFNEKAERGFARIESQMVKQIAAIEAAQPFDLSFHVWQAATENAYLDAQEEFANGAITEETLVVTLGGAESIIDSFYRTGWY